MKALEQFRIVTVGIAQVIAGTFAVLIQQLNNIRLASAFSGRCVIIVAGSLAVAVAILVSIHRSRVDHATTPVEPLRSAEIERTISGCYVKGDDGERIVYAGIVSPGRTQPLGDLAWRRNRELVEGQTVRLRFGHNEKDKDGRWVAFVFASDLMINEQLVAEGLAYVRLREGEDRFAERLLAAQNQARAARRGLWKRQVNTMETEYPADRKHAVFHRPDCQDVARIKEGRKVIFGKPAEAFAKGFAPCDHCRP